MIQVNKKGQFANKKVIGLFCFGGGKGVCSSSVLYKNHIKIVGLWKGGNYEMEGHL
jgi:hypothetical protein